MVYTSSDIQIIIFTHNRQDLLKQTLQSVLAQTTPGCPVWVLDNNSTDTTAQTVQQFSSLPIHYVKTTTPHCTANFIKAQEIMNQKFALILHDDDLLYPNYIQMILAALNKYPDTALIPTRAHHFYGTKIPADFFQNHPLNSSFYLLHTSEQAAGISWLPGGMVWSGSVARSHAYKKINIPALYAKYGKLMDWVVLNLLSQEGLSLVPQKDTLFYRRHMGQDSCANATGLTLEQALNWTQFFHQKMMGSPSHTEHSIYLLYSYKMIQAIYAYLSAQEKERFPWETSFLPTLLKRGLISRQAVFYSQRRKNTWGRVITLPIKLLYDRPFYKNSIAPL